MFGLCPFLFILLEVTVSDTSFSSLNDGDDVLIFFIGQSERSPLGYQHAVTMNCLLYTSDAADE